MNVVLMKPLFGLNNRIASMIISFAIFGYGIYTLFSEGVITSEYLRFLHVRDSVRKKEGHVTVKYSFESTTTSLFGLYEIEISMIKVCVSFLLFIVLLVGSSQRSKILLRIWLMIMAFVIIMGFLTTLVTLTDNHIHSSGTPTFTLNKFLITLAFSLWFSTIVLSLHEELVLEEQTSLDDVRIRNCKYVAKKRSNLEQSIAEKSPPYYDC